MAEVPQDRAYPRAGSLTQMHIGTVVDLEAYEPNWPKGQAARLKVQVRCESGYYNSCSLDIGGRVRTVERLNRVVKP
jgi:hypothetical protein